MNMGQVMAQIDSWDPVWEQVHQSREWGRYPSEELIRFVMRQWKHAPDRQAIRGLEIGCGQGANLWFLAREGFTAYGIDGSAAAIDRARDRLDTEVPGWRGELHVGDIRRLPFADGTFDMLIDNQATYANQFAAAQDMFMELSRVGRPAGRLFCRTFAPGSYGTGRQVDPDAWIFEDGPLAGLGYCRLTPAERIPDLLRGFSIISVDELNSTQSNRRISVNEWIIIAECKD
jgi:SAM-dependent methyltransferase